MLGTFLIVFFSLFIAQMGDKTQILTLLLAAKTKKHFLLFLGIMIAFFLSSSIAVIVGQQIIYFIPHKLVKLFSASLFIILGLVFLFSSHSITKKYHKLHLRNPFLSSIPVIFLADFGDKTQIAVAVFSTTYDPLVTLLASLASLALGTFLTIYLAKLITKRFKEQMLEKIAGVVFVGIGAFLYI